MVSREIKICLLRSSVLLRKAIQDQKQTVFWRVDNCRDILCDSDFLKN
jgi:hypothetical protein